MVDRAVKMLDLMYPYETHKIGVVYVGEGQVGGHGLNRWLLGDVAVILN